MIKTAGTGAVFAATLVLSAAAFAEGDIVSGQKIFETRCDSCHSLEAGARKSGPSLHGVGGRAAAKAENFPRYSGFLQAASEAGLTWSADNIAAYIQDPQGFVKAFNEAAGVLEPGRTNMTYRLRDEKAAADVAAYLISISQ